MGAQLQFQKQRHTAAPGLSPTSWSRLDHVSAAAWSTCTDLFNSTCEVPPADAAESVHPAPFQAFRASRCTHTLRTTPPCACFYCGILMASCRLVMLPYHATIWRTLCNVILQNRRGRVSDQLPALPPAGCQPPGACAGWPCGMQPVPAVCDSQGAEGAGGQSDLERSQQVSGQSQGDSSLST